MPFTVESSMKLWERFVADRLGSIAIGAALAAVPMLLGAGIATDYIRAVDIGTELQAAVDSSALGGAAADTALNPQKTAQAKAYFSRFPLFADVTPDVSFDGENVTVTARMKVATSFMSLAGYREMDVQATATAVTVTKPICVLALNQVDASSIDIFGSTANISAPACVVHSNSSSAKSLDSTSNTTSIADVFCTVGGYSGTHYSPLPKTRCRKVRDPYSGLTAPAVSGCDFSNAKKTGGSSTLSPGVYCGGLSIGGSASVTFQPGVYVIKDGPLSVTGNGGQIQGAGVTFYFLGEKAILNLSGGAEINLAAPASGPFTGLVFIQDKDNPPAKTNKITGDTNIKLVGVAYFPTQTLDIVGNGEFGILSPYMAFVADKLQFSGNGKLHLKLDPSAAGYTDHALKAYWGTRLVN